MILGRSTPQWLGLITAAGSLAQVLIVQFVPGADPVIVATVIGSVGLFLGAFITFLANTATTPIGDARLKSGTDVAVLNDDGERTGETVIIQPSWPVGPGGDAVDGHG